MAYVLIGLLLRRLPDKEFLAFARAFEAANQKNRVLREFFPHAFEIPDGDLRDLQNEVNARKERTAAVMTA